MKKHWIIYQFEENGENPHIYVIGTVTNEKDKEEALKRFVGSWAIAVSVLSWSKSRRK